MKNLFWKIRSTYYNCICNSHEFQSESGFFYLYLNGDIFLWRVEISRLSIGWERK